MQPLIVRMRYNGTHILPMMVNTHIEKEILLRRESRLLLTHQVVPLSPLSTKKRSTSGKGVDAPKAFVRRHPEIVTILTQQQGRAVYTCSRYV